MIWLECSNHNLNHDFLLTRLKAYRLDNNSVEFFHSYIPSSYQCCKISNSFSLQERVLAGVPLASILESLLFNIFITDIFLFLQKCELVNYANDSGMYPSDKNINNTMYSLNKTFAILPNWFHNTFTVLNPVEYSFILFGAEDELQTDVVSNNVTIINSKEKKVLGITTDSRAKDPLKRYTEGF